MNVRKSGINILVVDDDRELAATIEECLAGLGYNAVVAYEGFEGLDKFEQGDFQLVLTDLMMPEMDGIELLEAVKKQDNRVVVVIITGYGTIESAISAIKKGAFDYISKPVKLQELEVVIDRAVERYTIFKKIHIFRRLFFSLLFLSIGLLLIVLWFVLN